MITECEFVIKIACCDVIFQESCLNDYVDKVEELTEVELGSPHLNRV